MRVLWVTEGSRSYSAIRSEDPEMNIYQANNSYRGWCIFTFVYDGKKVNASRKGLTVECDELDEAFLKLAKVLPASSATVWKGAMHILEDKKLSDRRDARIKVIEYLQLTAIAKGLGK